MLFNSPEFIFLFLPITLIVYFLLNKGRLFAAAKSWLVFASLFFYSWWNIDYLPLILASVFVNFLLTQVLINDTNNRFVSRKFIFILALVFNIGLLSYFKYMDFFITNINDISGTAIPLLHIVLPLAISFFTLQQVAYIVDCYEGLAKERSFIDYTLFVVFFPQLIAGPIVHHAEMMPQFASVRNMLINYKNLATGLFVFAIGLFKKLVLADTFAVWANYGFDVAPSLNNIEAWSTSLAYTFQLYFDFSGYTEMALGIALMFNIAIPTNFNSPYKATGMIDFWKRWHITLTNFLTTYLYTPIIRSFSRLTFHKAMLATLITFLIAGLWHGASWMFVMFGLLNGVGIIANHYWKKTKIKMPTVLAWFITFNFVNITFIFFRAKEWSDAMKVLGGMYGFGGIVLPSPMSFVETLPFSPLLDIQYGHVFQHTNLSQEAFLWITGAFYIVLAGQNTMKLKEGLRLNMKTSVYTAGFLYLSFLYLGRVSDFIYFNF